MAPDVLCTDPRITYNFVGRISCSPTHINHKRFHLPPDNKAEAHRTIRALFIKRTSLRSIDLVMAKCLNARGAYVGVLSSWSLFFAAQIRRRTKTSRPRKLIIYSSLSVKAAFDTNASTRWFNSANSIL